MNNENQMKELVREKYTAIALQDKEQNAASCCGATSACCGDEVYNIMADDYSKLEGYNPDADLGLGCGLPTEFAKMKEGDTTWAAAPATMPSWPERLWAKKAKYWGSILPKP